MFRDRRDAGNQLGIALEKYRESDPLILGIPRGGVETAYYVAQQLGTDYSVLVARKLGSPRNPEYGIGAIAEDGSIYINDYARNFVTEKEISDIAEAEKREAERRVQKFRNGQALPSLKGRTVILVDDGIATGATLFAAIEMCKKQHPLKVVVAAPVAAREKVEDLATVVDEVVVLETPLFYTAVSQAYRSFENLSDEETQQFIDAAGTRDASHTNDH